MSQIDIVDADYPGGAVLPHKHHPGMLAYVVLALAVILALFGTVQALAVNRERAKAASQANCEAIVPLVGVVVNNLNQLTAARRLGSGATPEQVAIQEKANEEAKKYRQEQLKNLQVFRCASIGDSSNPKEVALPVESTPSTVIGPSGEIGPVGLTGPIGQPGPQGLIGSQGPQGISGTIGSTGSPGSPGQTGSIGPQGPTGPTGPEGPPAPTTTTTTTTLPPTTTTTTCGLDLLGIPLC